jgi:putative ABC transport system substrate-binding protein
MKRRAFLRASISALAAPLAAEAQQAGKVARIGYLSTGTETGNAALRKAFIEGLREHGMVEGKDILIESRWEGAGKATLDALAAELVRLPLDLILATDTPSCLAVKRTGTALPVVFATVSEPVVIGLVASLARPGGNFTGLTTINRELMAKRLELLKSAIPGLTHVGYLANPGYAVHQTQLTEMGPAAHGLGLTLHINEVRTPSEFEGAFARMSAAHVGALLVQQDPLFISHRLAIIELANRRRLPSMYPFGLNPRSGGLMSYGANAQDLYRRSADYVHRILKGAKPSELPVERPARFELIVNLKTARALGLTLPQSFLQRVDEVIE